MGNYFDTQGRPLKDAMEWAALFEQRGSEADDRWWRVGQTQIGDAEISTVWLGLDHNLLGDGPPLIFESMVFGGPLDGEQRRYSTWEKAERGHAQLVKHCKAEAA